MNQLSARQLAEWLEDAARPGPLLLDIREGWEVNLCQIEGSRHVPMQAIPARLESLPKDEAIVVYCHHGIRSMRVAAYLGQHGFKSIYNLQGGIEAWATDVARDMARY